MRNNQLFINRVLTNIFIFVFFIFFIGSFSHKVEQIHPNCYKSAASIDVGQINNIASFDTFIFSFDYNLLPVNFLNAINHFDIAKQQIVFNNSIENRIRVLKLKEVLIKTTVMQRFIIENYKVATDFPPLFI